MVGFSDNSWLLKMSFWRLWAFMVVALDLFHWKTWECTRKDSHGSRHTSPTSKHRLTMPKLPNTLDLKPNTCNLARPVTLSVVGTTVEWLKLTIVMVGVDVRCHPECLLLFLTAFTTSLTTRWVWTRHFCWSSATKVPCLWPNCTISDQFSGAPSRASLPRPSV